MQMELKSQVQGKCEYEAASSVKMVLPLDVPSFSIGG